MISPDRLLIQQQVYNFLRTVTIKYEPIAHYINNTLFQKGIAVNFEDRRTWKYYLNLTGQYHASDTPMYVTSLDTQQRILFSPETLADNLRTKAVYAPGGAYYNRLCDLYPEQVDLIKSILFPISSIEKAIKSPDLSLLGYGSGYLEEYEEPFFIQDIEDFLVILKERWYFDFLDDEPYFYLTFWTSLWTYLAMLIMSGRFANIRTSRVHSWDLWNTLQAAGLDNYSDILDRKKSMMLYQNIDYFKVNAGKQSNLIILADRLLESFGIGLYGRMVVQETETGAENYQLTPQLVPVRLPNNSEALPAQIEIKTVSTVQTEIFEKGLTSSTAAEIVAAVERKLGDTTLNEFFTKFVEIRPIARHKPYAEALNLFLIETLVVSITEGYYHEPVEVIDPLTREPIYLPPAELLALYHYAIQQSMGIDNDLFPKHAQLYSSFIPAIKTPKNHVYHFGRFLRLWEQESATAYLAGLTYDKNVSTPAEFSENVTRLWLRFMDHRLADQNTILDKRYEIQKYLSTMCHERRVIPLDLVKNYTRYSDWLGPTGIDVTSTILTQYDLQSDPRAQWENLADAIITALIPVNKTLLSFGNFTLSDFGYNRLRQLFIQMCSYRIVVLESERDTPEFFGPAKWSTGYGPDDTKSYGDFIIPTEVSTEDHSVMGADIDLHRGVVADTTTFMETIGTYTVTTTSTGHMTMTQSSEQAPTAYHKTGVTMVQGALHLPYTSTIPVMVKPSVS